MFFEGSEKKAEIIINQDELCLLTDISEEFWQGLVSCCNAKILSSISNKTCKAFLLSESSLFVWSNKLLILTCGVTTLAKSIEFFIQNVAAKHIAHITYQRKNEYFSHAQLSSFGEDTKLLTQYINGKAYRFGELDSHHNFIFHQDNQYVADVDDRTYGLLAYQISRTASQLLTTPGLSAQSIRDFFSIETLLPDFQLDDFVFKPYGYSLNAIKGQHYLTIHVTPQTQSSYVSIEANFDLVAIVQHILALLSPVSFDLLGFNTPEFIDEIQHSLSDNYVSKSLVKSTLPNNYKVSFANFVQPQQHYVNAIELDLTKENHAL